MWTAAVQLSRVSWDLPTRSRAARWIPIGGLLQRSTPIPGQEVVVLFLPQQICIVVLQRVCALVLVNTMQRSRRCCMPCRR